jgi:hypothetical protein
MYFLYSGRYWPFSESKFGKILDLSQQCVGFRFFYIREIKEK